MGDSFAGENALRPSDRGLLYAITGETFFFICAMNAILLGKAPFALFRFESTANGSCGCRMCSASRPQDEAYFVNDFSPCTMYSP